MVVLPDDHHPPGPVTSLGDVVEVEDDNGVKVAANQSEPASGGTMLGKLRQFYADTRATLAKDEDATYVAQLEEAEDRILHAFEDALESADNDVRVLLAVEMPKVRACHDRMRALKQNMQ